jgi:hypothetical protein
MSESGPSIPQPTGLDSIKSRLEGRFSMPKVDPSLKRTIQKVALAGIVGLSTLTASEGTNVRPNQAPPITPSPTSIYTPDLHEEKQNNIKLFLRP